MSQAEPLIEVKPDDPLLNQTELRRWLEQTLGWRAEDIRIEGRFPGGNANLCYPLSHGGRDYVLRRPPGGRLPPKAHDMVREFRVLSRIHPQFSLAPEPVALCEDPSVLGSAFLIMDRRHGTVIRDAQAAQLRADPARNLKISRMLIETLVTFHGIDSSGMIAARLGRPEAFLERQWKNWNTRATASGIEGERVAKIRDWLSAALPPPQPTAVVHNDYKLDNLIVTADDWSRPVGLLDWDLCTVGDPLIDLGILLTYWVEPEDAESWRLGASMPTWVRGFLSRKEVAQAYADASGRSLAHLPWYVVFGNFRVMVALAQIYNRYLETRQGPPHFAQMGERIDILQDKCLHLIEYGL